MTIVYQYYKELENLNIDVQMEPSFMSLGIVLDNIIKCFYLQEYFMEHQQYLAVSCFGISVRYFYCFGWYNPKFEHHKFTLVSTLVGKAKAYFILAGLHIYPA
ncbi:uncharacterized protein LOC143200025 [Rhynchophorus ferrugineus]|uniref:uncharacterized protein LOC143200025 n=1 Tax=Rhynchophorus ferrugineus TaxID=354439 RepID=UPI003FCE3C05